MKITSHAQMARVKAGTSAPRRPEFYGHPRTKNPALVALQSKRFAKWLAQATAALGKTP